jgi:DNA-binding NarL/FixJ family response regulator
MKKSKDWIALIEAGYQLEGDDREWLDSLLTYAEPLGERGFWLTIGRYDYTPIDILLNEIKSNGPSAARRILESSLRVETEAVSHFFRAGKPVSSLSEAIYTSEPEIAEVVKEVSNGVVHDKLAVKALNGEGGALIMCWLFNDYVVPTELERRRWGCIASHLGTGLRLRKVAEKLTLEADRVEAIYDGNFKLCDARSHAKSRSSREILLSAIKRIDKARSKSGRDDPDVAMKTWKGLVQGRWSLVDYFDSDQRRYIVAVQNDPNHPDPRGLTQREKQVAEFIGHGLSTKEISYTLGISQSAVTNCTTRAKRKLGLTSRIELAAFFAPTGVRAKLAQFSLAGEKLLVSAYTLVEWQSCDMLTEAESAVLAHLVAGSTNKDIALRRRTSEHTVNNQIQSIFRKLHVNSRSSLMIRLQELAAYS